MPEKPLSMTLADHAALIGEPCEGPISDQRALTDALLQRSGWPKPSKLPNGKPIVEHGHCSVSHGGGWVFAAHSPVPIGIDVEAATPRLQKARRRFVGPADQPVLDFFGDNLDTLCRLWTAKEAAFKVFGSGLDFLTGLEWKAVNSHSARATATVQGMDLDISWQQLSSPTAWLAVALNNEQA